MTLLNTLTRKTARVRMERKLTVSKTKVFVPKLVGTKICLPVSSSSTLVPAVFSCCRRSPPPPAILACHLILKHERSSRRYLFWTTVSWRWHWGFDHNHFFIRSCTPSTTLTLTFVFLLSPSNAIHFPSQFSQDAFSYFHCDLLPVRILINYHNFVLLAFDTTCNNKSTLNMHTFSLLALWHIFKRVRPTICPSTKTALYDLAVELTSLKPIHWSRQLRCNKLIICAARKFAGLVQTSVALSVDPVWFNSEEARTERTYLSFVQMGDESV